MKNILEKNGLKKFACHCIKEIYLANLIKTPLVKPTKKNHRETFPRL